MFDAWACGCPVILSIEGEARDVLERARAGVFVQPENPEEMVQAILHLKNEPEVRLCLGENGRRFVEEHYSRQHLAARLETLLVQEIERSAGLG
jgi:glycosyltransferase involved in cell wall biosynthesis